METIVLKVESVNLYVMKNKIQEILNEDINVHAGLMEFMRNIVKVTKYLVTKPLTKA